jgi:hypothetical protein
MMDLTRQILPIGDNSCRADRPRLFAALATARRRQTLYNDSPSPLFAGFFRP